MGILTDKLKSGVVGEAVRATSGSFKTFAKVIDANESSNICSILFVNKNGDTEQITDVQVDLRNTTWFPSKNDNVLAEINNKSAVVLCAYPSDYQKDIRGKQKLKNDTLPEGNSTCTAGQIL